jgi:spore germination protein GerM
MTRRLRRTLSVSVIVMLAVVLTGCGTASTTPTPTPVATVTATATPTASPTPTVTHDVVYFARDRLPPVGIRVPGAGAGATPDDRIRSRLAALFVTPAPTGDLFNTALAATARPAAVSVDAGLAVVDFSVPGDLWGVAGSAGTRAFIQQLIYTITEEPGVDQALITQNGGQMAIVNGEGVMIDHPSGRAEVAGYLVRASVDPIRSFEGEPPLTPLATLASSHSVDIVAPALARVTVELDRPGGDARWMPTFDASVLDGAPLGTKHELRLSVYDGIAPTSDIIVDRTPLRRLKIETSLEPRKTIYRLGLDDLWPWRVAVAFAPVRIVLDVGGDPDAVSDNIAVYEPRFSEQVGPGAKLSGATRAFEAAFEYRFSDIFGEPLGGGYGMASYGTSAIWGLFDLALGEIPANTANVEVLQRSPRDGEISDIVRVSVIVAR